MEEVKLTRKELYDLVWSKPMTFLSKKYNLSDVGLRKICLKMNIPLPKAGYWEKIKWNKPVSIEILDETYTGVQDVTFNLDKNKKTIISNNHSSVKNLQKEIEKNLSLTVPSKLSSPHKLIIAARDNLNRKDRYVNNGLVSTQRGHLDIKVSPVNITRTLRFMDTLIKVLNKRGHDVILENENTYAIVFNEQIKISLREKLKRTIVPGKYYEHAEYNPTGLLCFRIDGFYGKEWIDGKLLIEDQLSNIISKLEHESNRIKVQKEETRKFHEKFEEKQRIKREAEEQKQKELIDFTELLLSAERWRKATLLRSYIHDVEQQAILKKTVSAELNNWIHWARQKVNWYDPFINASDELLEDVDKDTLTFKKKKPTDFF